MERDTVLFGRSVWTYQRLLLMQHHLPCRWRLEDLLKRQHISTKLHGVTMHNMAVSLTSNITQRPFIKQAHRSYLRQVVRHATRREFKNCLYLWIHSCISAPHPSDNDVEVSWNLSSQELLSPRTYIECNPRRITYYRCGWCFLQHLSKSVNSFNAILRLMMKPHKIIRNHSEEVA